MNSNPNFPTFICDNYDLHWQMTRWEKIFLTSFLNKYKFKYAIEIGTYKGGSLQVLSEFCEKVCSIDISEESKKNLSDKFLNVEFLVGDSKKLLPEKLEDLKNKGINLDFVLIDGDHSTNGVFTDITNIINNYSKLGELFIICHDSFNPDCRSGIRNVDYASNRYVHFVEIDFIPGVYHYEAFDTAESRSMWGGFALIHLKPIVNNDILNIKESQIGLFETVYKHSVHYRRD